MLQHMQPKQREDGEEAGRLHGNSSPRRNHKTTPTKEAVITWCGTTVQAANPEPAERKSSKDVQPPCSQLAQGALHNEPSQQGS